MCGRYVLFLRPSQIRQRLEDQHMPTSCAPPDNDPQLRQSYNFAPGNHGLIYRAETGDYGFGGDRNAAEDGQEGGSAKDGEPAAKRVKLSEKEAADGKDGAGATTYKLQSAKWGLIPSWTRSTPNYASQLKTINCRDDSLRENRGLWNTMKARKRCVVVAEGFYEWLKKGSNGKERVPHYIKRKDGRLMCLAGLWDVCQLEATGGSVDGGRKKAGEKVYSYTVITTDSNAQLKFLHDRMPVILEPGSEEMKAWVDPGRAGWNKELQDILKPFGGELECYVVDKAVGNVRNDRPSFVLPLDSVENRNNIANFFQRSPEKKKKVESSEVGVLATSEKAEDPESNAPLPKPKEEPENEFERALQKADLTSFSSSSSSSSVARSSISIAKDQGPASHSWEYDNDDDDNDDDGDFDIPDEQLSAAADKFVDEIIEQEVGDVDDEALFAASMSPPRKMVRVGRVATPSSLRKGFDNGTPTKLSSTTKTNLGEDDGRPKTPKTPSSTARVAGEIGTGAGTRSATSNAKKSGDVPKTPTKTPTKGKDAKITSFFKS